jgi:hypothetical protein
MTAKQIRGVVRGGTVLLENQAQLREGTEVIVTPAVGARGSPAAIIAAMDAAPKVPGEWVDELERLIAQGSRPPATPDVFPEAEPSREFR